MSTRSRTRTRTRTLVPGVYKLKERAGDANSPVVYYDGESFWLPGWECRLRPTASGGGQTSLNTADVGELVWADDELSPDEQDAR